MPRIKTICIVGKVSPDNFTNTVIKQNEKALNIIKVAPGVIGDILEIV